MFLLVSFVVKENVFYRKGHKDGREEHKVIDAARHSFVNVHKTIIIPSRWQAKRHYCLEKEIRVLAKTRSGTIGTGVVRDLFIPSPPCRFPCQRWASGSFSCRPPILSIVPHVLSLCRRRNDFRRILLARDETFQRKDATFHAHHHILYSRQEILVLKTNQHWLRTRSSAAPQYYRSQRSC